MVLLACGFVISSYGMRSYAGQELAVFRAYFYCSFCKVNIEHSRQRPDLITHLKLEHCVCGPCDIQFATSEALQKHCETDKEHKAKVVLIRK